MHKLYKDPFLKDPLFLHMIEFRKEFDQMFNRFFDVPWLKEEFTPTLGFLPPVEAYIDHKEKKFFMKIAIPGVKPEELKLHQHGNLLTLSGERKYVPELKEKELDYLHREFQYGVFERTLTLPEAVDTDRLMAEYKNGVLEVTAPVIVGALPRPIEIKTLLPEMKKVAV